jgi:hypothetical protein
MVIPQFGMIIRLSQHRWFYKLELLVFLSITCLCTSSFFSTSLIHLLELCKLYLSLSPGSSFGLQCSSSCWVKENIWSISLTLLAHCDLLSFVDDFKVGSSIAKGNIGRGSRREYKEFKMQTLFFPRVFMFLIPNLGSRSYRQHYALIPFCNAPTFELRWNTCVKCYSLDHW